MLGFQTLSCLHDIPVVRSSTNKLQDVYAKAKDTSALIRLPCNLAETVADKSLKFALTIANPLVKPLSGPVRVIDDYAVQKIRQIESKYPVINTPTEDVVNTFNEKTEPVRNVMNSVKDTTTSTIQHGKETVSNVATATVNKASGVADSVFTFCETHVPGIQGRHNRRLTVESLFNYVFQPVQSSLIWFRMLIVFVLLKTKQINDVVLNKIQQKSKLTVLPQRLLILLGTFLDTFIGHIRPDDRTLAELKKTKQQSRLSQQTRFFANRESSKPDSFVTTRQSVVVTKQETVVNRTNDLRQARHNVDDDSLTTEPIDFVSSNDIAQLHDQFKATDVELLFSKLPTDIITNIDNHEPLTDDQQALHDRIIDGGLGHRGDDVDGNDDDDEE